MRRLMSVATRSGCSRATSRAAWPTTASPSAGRSTALGVSMSPSRLGSVTGWPGSSSVATAQNVFARLRSEGERRERPLGRVVAGRADQRGRDLADRLDLHRELQLHVAVELQPHLAALDGDHRGRELAAGDLDLARVPAGGGRVE